MAVLILKDDIDSIDFIKSASNTLSHSGATTLAATMNTSTTDLDVVGNSALTNGHYVYLYGIDKYEMMLITSTASSLGGGNYRYTVTRNVDGGGADSWAVGDRVVDIGSSPVTSVCWLEDDTFQAQIPSKKEVRYNSNIDSGRDLLSMSYANRVITFSFRIVANSEALIFDKIMKINRMILRAQSNSYINSGAYQQNLTLNDGENTGDQGFVLRVRLHNSNETIPAGVTWGRESTGSSYGSSTLPNILTFRIISADLQVDHQITSVKTFSFQGQAKYTKYCTISLECEPFALGQSRIVGSVGGNGYYAYPVSPEEAKSNRMIISGDAIPGDAPALTRISTQLDNAQGILIARDAGESILNCPSYPLYSGSGLNDMFVYGQVASDTGHTYEVRTANTASNPDQYQWRVDGGSWSTAANIVAHTPIEIVSGVFIFFWNANGHNGTEKWEFTNNQAVVTPLVPASYNLYSNIIQATSPDGGTIGGVYINIPPGCRSRYKVYAKFTITGSPTYLDYRMQVSYLGYGSSGNRTITQTQKYDWIRGNAGFVDCGIIDLTPRVFPQRLHPFAHSEANITFGVRSNGNVPNPSSIALSRVFLVPYQDEYSFLHAGWAFDSEGREIYCNFDPSNPYIGEVSATYQDSPNPTIVSIVPLDETHSGNVITLIPGVRNTILFLPMVTASTDWRDGSPGTSGITGEVSVAIRPRYMFGA